MNKFYKVYINPSLGYYSNESKQTYEIESFSLTILDYLSATKLWKEEHTQNHMCIGSRCLICEAANII